MLKGSLSGRRARLVLVFAATVATGNVNIALGDSLKWDTTANGDAVVTDGGGTWANGTGNFNTGVAPFDHTWTNSADAGNIAVFGNGAAGGTVTVSGTVQAAGITFGPIASNQSYKLTAAATGTPKISLATDSTITYQDKSSNTQNTARTTIAVALDANNLTLFAEPGGGAFIDFSTNVPHNITGTLTIGTNIFVPAHPSFIANAGGVTVASGSTFVINSAGTWNPSTPFTVSGTGIGGTRGAIRFDQDATLNMPIKLAAATTLNANGKTGTIAGAVTEAAANTPLTVGFSASTLNFSSAANSYSGPTTITQGTMGLTGAGKLTATPSISVKPGAAATAAQFLFNSVSNAVPSNIAMALDTSIDATASATLRTAGKSQVMGTLTISGSGTNIISYNNTASAATLAFADSKSIVWSGNLKVYNYGGIPITGGGTQQLTFANAGLTPTQLSQISFYSDGGTTLIGTGQFATGNPNEVVPTPEPGAISLLGLASLGLLRRRRRA